MAKRIISLMVTMLIMVNVMAPAAEACYRHLPPPPPRYGRIYRRPRHHHRHHHDRTGAVITGVIIGAILASR